MMSKADLLAAYDEDLRIEVVTAESVTHHGPLVMATYAHGRGFVTYRDLDGRDPDELVQAALAHFGADPEIRRIEWKTRGHDHAPGLHRALVGAGFEPDEPESIMIGEAVKLALDLPLPPGVTLRRIHSDADVRAMCELQDEVFGEHLADEFTDALTKRLALDEGMQLWVAEAAGRMVCGGRLEPVQDTSFAGIWGGGTLPQWRRRGIYRALTAARAREALALGKTLIHSDSTEGSRPILERSGLVKVSTTTPYEWCRDD